MLQAKSLLTFSNRLHHVVTHRLLVQRCPTLKVLGVQSNVCFFSSSSVRKVNADPASVVAAVQSAQHVTAIQDFQGFEPSFAELGLGTGWWPMDFIQSALETAYVSTGLPWWMTIVLGTLSIRLITLPIYIGTRKYMVRQSNCMQKQKKLLDKVKEHRGGGNTIYEYEALAKWRTFIKENRIGPIRGIAMNLPMPVLFISMMMALREMVSVPVPSLEASAILWVDSLCSYDPYYVLPTLAGAIVGITIRTSFKAGMISTPSDTAVKLMKYLPFLPPVVMPLLMGHFASGLMVYVMTNSCFTFCMANVLQVERIKKAIKMPILRPRAVEERKSTTLMKSYNEFQQDHVKKQELKQIKKLKKQREKDLKNSLKQVPTTFAIGSEAFEKIYEPDFEKQWRPPRPKMPGLL